MKRWPAPRHPIRIYTHHKVGTVLMMQVFGGLGRVLGWSMRRVYGHGADVDPSVDVVVFGHGVPEQLPNDPNVRAIHIVRDPREVLVSGYLYHRHTDEAWCIEVPPENLPVPIQFPLAPHAVADRDREFLVEYVRSLGGRSYQENVLTADTTDGLLFELEHYAQWTIEEMASWRRVSDPRVMTVSLEEIMASFDDSMDRIAAHLRLRGPERRLLRLIARRQDLGRKSERDLARMSHVHAPAPDRWKQHLTEPVLQRLAEVTTAHGLGGDRGRNETDQPD